LDAHIEFEAATLFLCGSFGFPQREQMTRLPFLVEIDSVSGALQHVDFGRFISS